MKTLLACVSAGLLVANFATQVGAEGVDEKPAGAQEVIVEGAEVANSNIAAFSGNTGQRGCVYKNYEYSDGAVILGGSYRQDCNNGKWQLQKDNPSATCYFKNILYSTGAEVAQANGPKKCSDKGHWE